jgi:hypothetical protein
VCSSQQNNISLFLFWQLSTMKIVKLLLILFSMAIAEEIEVQDQVFCAMDQLAMLVAKQDVLINELIQLKADYNQSSDYFAR